MPSRQDRTEGHSRHGWDNALHRLLVVNRHGGELLSLGIGSGCSHSAAFAVRCDNYATGHRHLSLFLDGHRERSRANPSVSPAVGRGITGEGVIFPVKLSGPFIVYSITCRIGTINNDLSTVARSL